VGEILRFPSELERDSEKVAGVAARAISEPGNGVPGMVCGGVRSIPDI